MSYYAIKPVPVNDNIGAEINGVDLAAIDELELATELRQALAEYGVIFFRDQTIDATQFAALAKAFGEPQEYGDSKKAIFGYPFMSEIRKDEDQETNVGGNWHADQTWRTSPATATLLIARETPAYGGDTLFSSMAAAYDALSDGFKRALLTLKAVHSNERVAAILKREKRPDMVHPVVITHPLTGRKSLFVNPGYVVRFEGWSAAESEPLLRFLFAHGQRPEFQCRFKWTTNSVAIWDNTQLWHYAVNDYHGHRRLMHRVTVQGFVISE
jgi:taurine dioxygenase